MARAFPPFVASSFRCPCAFVAVPSCQLSLLPRCRWSHPPLILPLGGMAWVLAFLGLPCGGRSVPVACGLSLPCPWASGSSVVVAVARAVVLAVVVPLSSCRAGSVAVVLVAAPLAGCSVRALWVGVGALGASCGLGLLVPLLLPCPVASRRCLGGPVSLFHSRVRLPSSCFGLFTQPSAVSRRKLRNSSVERVLNKVRDAAHVTVCLVFL